MFEFCTNPDTLNTAPWFACYLTTGIHMNLYISVVVVLVLLAVTAPVSLAFGFAGAVASRSRFLPLSLLGKTYTSMVRGIPDILFFLFFVIALDQAMEWSKHHIVCPDWTDPIRQGANFLVCPEAKIPASTSPQWVHEVYGFALAVVTFAIVFGAFVANVLYGAMMTVPSAQLETAEAYGMSHRQVFWRVLVPQMWIYALPGLSNIWMILIKATPLLFLLGVEDVVYWARELGATKASRFFDFPHGDWRLWYFLALLVLYLIGTKLSEMALARLTLRLSRGQPIAGNRR
ncbi:MAG: ABC transporter permease subunit [Boseongicola sp.]|nr:MAG: ABC transporter permease subunit [Boseongicola sp.]